MNKLIFLPLLILRAGCKETDKTAKSSQTPIFMKIAVLFLVAVSAFLTGCSGGLSKKAAGEAIEKTLQKSKISIRLAFGRVGTQCANPALGVSNQDPTSNIAYTTAQKAGWITITPDGPNFWKVELIGLKPSIADKIKKDPHLGANGCDYQITDFVVASKSLVDVTNVSEVTNAAAEVEFHWKWTLSFWGRKLVDQFSGAELAELDRYFLNSAYSQPDSQFSLVNLSHSIETHTGKLTLQKSDDGWRVAK